MSDMLKRFSPCYERSGKVVLRVSIGWYGGETSFCGGCGGYRGLGQPDGA
ncbi:hypothetical protein [Thermanaerovibrio velox]|nr:hypothetical protein [Thermanaerovibrio velox]